MFIKPLVGRVGTSNN